MDRKDIESSVTRVVEDLNQKIAAMEAAAVKADSQKAMEAKDKAVEILNRVSKKFIQTATDVRNSQEFKDGVTYVMSKSKELYENTMAKIEEFSKKPEVVSTISKVNETIDKTIKNVENAPKFNEAVNDIGSLFDGVKRNVSEFAEKEEVSQKVEQVKRETVDLAEKGLNVLKEWLSPKGDD